MNEIEQAANDCKDNIMEVISLIGKEGCIKCYEYQKTRMPKIYAYGCKILGRDLVEYINSL